MLGLQTTALNFGFKEAQSKREWHSISQAQASQRSKVSRCSHSRSFQSCFSTTSREVQREARKTGSSAWRRAQALARVMRSRALAADASKFWLPLRAAEAGRRCTVRSVSAKSLAVRSSCGTTPWPHQVCPFQTSGRGRPKPKPQR